MSIKHRLPIALAACILAQSALYPEAAHCQTLLETWAFLLWHDYIDITELKETQPGVLILPHKPNVLTDPGAETMYTVKDVDNCVIREEKVPRDPLFWQEYYLNNVLPEYRVGSDEKGIFVKLIGEKAIYCQPIGADPRPHCYTEFNLRTGQESMVIRLERALKYVYANFCSFAESKKSPF